LWLRTCWADYCGACMSLSDRRLNLRGRRSECYVLDRLLERVRTGESQALVLRGEAGAGKTALLKYLVERASECRVARVAGVESEMELAFAGVQQLCGPFLDRLGDLPDPQRVALTTAFGLASGDPPDRFLVGLAVLSLLAEVAEAEPLVCVVDDAQWLDRVSAQLLAFVARRLLAERVAVVFAVREPADDRDLGGLDELVVGGLNDEDARALLDSVITGPVDDRVRERILFETRGNPLALLELPRGFTPAEMAGGFGLLDAMPLTGRLEQGFERRLEPLSIETRRLLLAAALEPVGDANLLWRAAARLGIGADAATGAEEAGLIEFGGRVRFRHPLARSAAYRLASTQDRQDVHRALAEVTDPELDPDRRAWHLARATVVPDEAVAGELERSAARAQARGGIAATAAFLECATRLTPDPALQGARALAAAQAKFEAAAPDAASELLATAELCPLDALQRARLERLRAQLVFDRQRGAAAPSLLLAAAQRLEPLDTGCARETYLDALGAAIFAGRLNGHQALREVALAARSAPPGAEPARATDLLVDGLSIRFTDGYVASVAPLRRALRAFVAEQRRGEADLRWLWLAWPVANELWDDEAWHELTTRAVGAARDAGALAVLPIALLYRAGVHIYAGEFAASTALIEEARAINEATGHTPLTYVAPVLSAARGDEALTLELTEPSIRGATARGEGRAISGAEFAQAMLYNGLGRYEDALAAAQRASDHDDLGLIGWVLAELVEAAARSDNRALGVAAVRRLQERTGAAGTDWALGIQARSRALLSDGEDADGLYREAIERLASGRLALYRARAELVYGEWLRRESRRVDARDHLHAAHEQFAAMGAEAFAERARRELLATGETVRKRTVETIDDLTAQERQIAGMAREGLSNPEIGAQLFLSARTVEWHLGKVFLKLGIRSRKELAGAL
jgi:DNA-binding CsgD family transcriptional regulator